MNVLLETPLAPLTALELIPPEEVAFYADYTRWWQEEGGSIGEDIDRAGTPWLRMFDRWGHRVDEILYPQEYWTMLRKGYTSGIVRRVFDRKTLWPFYLMGYVTSFFEPGVYCPYTVTLGTAVPVAKYAPEAVREHFLPLLLRTDKQVWQGATWMTEVGGGSDLGTYVQTQARSEGDGWYLTGEKYFASNVGAELAVVAARPEGAPEGVRGLALFLVPRYRQDGRLNYTIRRLKDKIATRGVPTGEVELKESEGYLLGTPEVGVYLILEVLNLSRVANSVAAVAVAQRALAEAVRFAERRVAFGRPVLEHPLYRSQLRQWMELLQEASALAWEAVRRLDEVWTERPPAYSEAYHTFRLVAHLAKYWTAELAVRITRWAIEAHGAMGVMAEYGIERWLREALILAIWEGTAHRQVLDGVEVMLRRRAHEPLLDALKEADPEAVEAWKRELHSFLELPEADRESHADHLFERLARFVAHALWEQKPFHFRLS